MRSGKRITAAAAGAITLLWLALAGAAEPDPQELYRRGTEAYREARYEDAIGLLAAAHRLEPHAELAYDLGRAYEGAGDLRSAVESFREYLKLAPDAKDREAVERRIANIASRIEAGRERVTIASHPGDAAVTVDGGLLGGTPWKGALTRGAHRVVLTRRGYRDAVRSILVTQGQSLVLFEELEAETPSRAPVASESRSPLARIRPLTWIALGVGAAALGTAAAFLIAENSAEDDARGSPTQLGYRTAYEAAESNRDAARVAFVVGAAAAVTGGVLLTLDLTRGSPGEPRAATRRGVRFAVGIGRAAFEGQF